LEGNQPGVRDQHIRDGAVRRQIVHDRDVAWREGGAQPLVGAGEEGVAVHRSASRTKGAAIASRRGAAVKVVVFQRPKGCSPIRRRPLGARPYRRTLLVSVAVSSMKTSFLGSRRA
jgi:hypothetical protein